jgi:WD40 repeat protein
MMFDVSSAAFSPDGRHIVIASADKTARPWDAETGKQLSEPMRHELDVWSAAFSLDGCRIVTTSNDYTTQIWDA